MELSNCKILIVEDIESNYMLLEYIFENQEIMWAHNGEEAVQMARNNSFDCILMDIKMPLMNGMEATKKIREFNTTVPIIAISANAFEIDRINAKEAGCNEFITKPIRKNDIIALINKVLK